MTELSFAICIIAFYIGLGLRLSRLERSINGNIDNLRNRLDSHKTYE